MTEPTDAQKRFDEAALRYEGSQPKPGRVDAVASMAVNAIRRAEEVETELREISETVSHDLQSLHTRLLKLESAAREPATTEADDPLCASRIRVLDCSGWSCYGCPSTKVNTQIWVDKEIIYLCQECVNALAAALGERVKS